MHLSENANHFTTLRIEFRKVRMNVRQNPETYPSIDWSGLHVRLTRIYEGEPLRDRQHIPRSDTEWVTLWHLQKGTSKVECEGLTCSAKKGEWIVCLPGERWQDFSADARILSIHLRIEHAWLCTKWEGAHLVAPGHVTSFDKAAGGLRKVAQRLNLCRDHFIHDESVLLPLTDIMELQEKLAHLVRQLLLLLLPMGIRFTPITSSDNRVNDGLKWLSAQPLANPFSRAEVARLGRLGSSHLDRLWRREIGMTPHQYWENRRKKFACDQLRNPAKAIKEIAFDLGFLQPSQFSTWFRSHYKESPKQFRLHAIMA